MAKMALVRHGQSEWNAKGLWTGWQDIKLTLQGKEEAKDASILLQDVNFHYYYSSPLKRAEDTLKIIKKHHNSSLPHIIHEALKERHYGEFTGKNKWEIQKIVGHEKFNKIRRGWNEPIKGGETLKNVYERTVPYFQKIILPHLKANLNILLVAHGNTIRALIKHLENLSDEKIEEVELRTGEIIIYEFARTGKIINSERRRKNVE